MLNFHIEKPHEFRTFWVATNGPFFYFRKGYVTSLKMCSLAESKEMYAKSL